MSLAIAHYNYYDITFAAHRHIINALLNNIASLISVICGCRLQLISSVHWKLFLVQKCNFSWQPYHLAAAAAAGTRS